MILIISRSTQVVDELRDGFLDGAREGYFPASIANDIVVESKLENAGKHNEPNKLVLIDLTTVLINDADLERLQHNSATVAFLLSEDLKLRADQEQIVLKSAIKNNISDLLYLPLRKLDLARVWRFWKSQTTQHQEIGDLTGGVKEILEQYQQDLNLTRSIQESLIPKKFESVSGLDVKHRYFSGLKPGGDYLDFFEFDDKTHVGILMSHATGYGLSSSFLAVLLKMTLRVTQSQNDFSPKSTLKKISTELQSVIKEHESLSLIYIILNRKTLDLKFASIGSLDLYHYSKDFSYLKRSKDLDPMTKDGKNSIREESFSLRAGDKLLLFSEGFKKSFESEDRLQSVVSGCANADVLDLINEFCFAARKKFDHELEMPTQDCSIMCVHVDEKILRLAK